MKPTVEKPLLIGILVDVSGSMLNSIQNASGETKSRLDSIRDSLDNLVLKAKELSQEGNRISPLVKLFAYGFGFGNFLSLIFNPEGSAVRDLLELPGSNSSTVSIDLLSENWVNYKQHIERLGTQMLGSTPMGEGMQRVLERFRMELSHGSYFGQPTLFLLSDGEPTDASEAEIVQIAEEMKNDGIIIISCYITDEDITLPRHLYGLASDNWKNETKLMFDCASNIPKDSSFHSYLAEYQWTIEPKGRLFTQINQSEILSEFMQTILSPLMEKDSKEDIISKPNLTKSNDMSEKYVDFDLRIGPDGHSVATSIEGNAADKISLDIPDDIELALSLIEARRTNETLLKRVGKALYDWLFPANIHTHFQQTEAVARHDQAKMRIRLHIEAEKIASLPLEFMFREVGGYFVAINPDTVLSRYLDLPLPPGQIRLGDKPLHMLAIIADPSDQTRLPPDEWEAIIKDTLASPLESGQMTLKSVKRATRKEIRNALLSEKPDIIQFVGHGIYRNGKGYLALVDDETGETWLVDDERFANLFLGYDDYLGLISLATCESAKSEDPQGFLGIAPKLVQRGVPAVLSMQYKVYVNTAKVFLEDFYTAVAARKSIDWATQSARNAISLEYGLDNREFATPVLYMRAKDGNVF